MQKVLALPAIALMVAISLATALTAFAYEDLEIEFDVTKSTTKVEVSYEIDDEEVEVRYTYNTTDRKEVYRLLANELDLSVAAVMEADEDRQDAAEEIDDAKEAIEKAEAYIARLDNNSKERDTYKSWLATAKRLLADAETAFAKYDYVRAERLAEQAEDKAEYIYESTDDKEDSDRGHGNNKDRCDKDNPGKAKYCEDSQKEKLGDRFKDYGKSNNRAELETQLRELMLILIQLLQQIRASV